MTDKIQAASDAVMQGFRVQYRDHRDASDIETVALLAVQERRQTLDAELHGDMIRRELSDAARLAVRNWLRLAANRAMDAIPGNLDASRAVAMTGKPSRSVLVHGRISREMQESFEQMCRERGISQSAAVREAVQRMMFEEAIKIKHAEKLGAIIIKVRE